VAKKQDSPAPGGWLFKEEPSTYSYAQLAKDGSTLWAGVANPLARKHLRQVKVGDRVLYYHTGKERAIVGEMRVTEGPTADPQQSDPKAVVVRVEAVRSWPQPVTLDRIKADSRFASWELVRMPRLSVMPVSPEQWRWLEELAVSGGPQGS
jgi:predicted RNA-binding protein with PUA-like domain